MNIPRSVIEPFGYTGIPLLTAQPLVDLIEEVTSRFFFAIQNREVKGLAARMEMAAIIAGASHSNCVVQIIRQGYWVTLEYKTHRGSAWHTQRFLHTYENS
jgi:hypothetical protein